LWPTPPANLIANGVEELLRWCGPQLLATPRYALEDVEIDVRYGNIALPPPAG
jgi:cytochrome P450